MITLLRNHRHASHAGTRAVACRLDIRHTQGLFLSHSPSLSPLPRFEFACETDQPHLHRQTWDFPNNAIPRRPGICIERHVDRSAPAPRPGWVSSASDPANCQTVCRHAPASWLCRGRATWAPGLPGLPGLPGFAHARVVGGLPGRMADTSASVLDGRDRLCVPLPEVRWQRGQPVGCGSVAGARLLAYLRHATVPVGPSVPPSLPHRRPGLLGLARPRLSPVPSPPYSKIN